MFKANLASISGKEGSVMNEILHVHTAPPMDDQGFSRNLGPLFLGVHWCSVTLQLVKHWIFRGGGPCVRITHPPVLWISTLG